MSGFFNCGEPVRGFASGAPTGTGGEKVSNPSSDGCMFVNHRTTQSGPGYVPPGRKEKKGALSFQIVASIFQFDCPRQLVLDA
jgi:hypothetical protein